MAEEQGSRLFVGNIPFNTSDRELLDVFEQIGPVLEAKVIKNRDTGMSRGFGFVTFENPSHAAEALERMNGYELQGRPMRVDRASSQRR